MRVERDVWLAEQLGYDAFRVVLESGSSHAQDAAAGVDPDLHFLTKCFPTRAAQAQPVFYYTKTPTQQITALGTLCRLGFRVVDVNVTLACAPRLLANPLPHEGVFVRKIEPEDHAAVLDIAGACFRYSRFHLDPAIPPARAHAIKRAWVRSYIEGQRGEQLLVAVVNGKPAGFLAVLKTLVKGQTCCVIDLIGVDPAYQGRGVGRALTGSFLVECTRRGALARVGTQAANIPSLRLYESLGFRVCDTAYVLHAHVGGEGIRP